jgi:hypothetical protein
VERLQEVRLPRAVRSDREDDARSKLELDARVGAEVPERDRIDDQTPTAR